MTACRSDLIYFVKKMAWWLLVSCLDVDILNKQFKNQIMLIKDAREMESGMAKITALIFSIALLFACSDSVDDPIVPPRNWESSDYVHKPNNTEMSYLYCPVYDRKFDTFKTHLMEIEWIPPTWSRRNFTESCKTLGSSNLTLHTDVYHQVATMLVDRLHQATPPQKLSWTWKSESI